MNFTQDDCGRKTSGFKESKDCTVRATAKCLGISYDEAHKRLSSFGRKNKKGYDYRKAAQKLGLELRPDLSCRSLEKILPEMSNGNFVVRIAGHVFAVVNGMVYDMNIPNPKYRVKMVYQNLSFSLDKSANSDTLST